MIPATANSANGPTCRGGKGNDLGIYDYCLFVLFFFFSFQNIRVGDNLFLDPVVERTLVTISRVIH